MTGNGWLKPENHQGKIDMTTKKIKILIGKPGLDGHDRGAKVTALALRDAGMEVIYTGLHQTVEQIVRTAVQEAVDVVGLSIMSGAHIPICQKLLEMMKDEGLQEIPVVVGGVIPKQDIPRLNELGIAGVFPGGTHFDEIVSGINEIVT
jgi:methylmalonyl-CoA mutase C-terminal domain/subunit